MNRVAVSQLSSSATMVVVTAVDVLVLDRRSILSIQRSRVSHPVSLQSTFALLCVQLRFCTPRFLRNKSTRTKQIQADLRLLSQLPKPSPLSPSPLSLFVSLVLTARGHPGSSVIGSLFSRARAGHAAARCRLPHRKPERPERYVHGRPTILCTYILTHL